MQHKKIQQEKYNSKSFHLFKILNESNIVSNRRKRKIKEKQEHIPHAEKATQNTRAHFAHGKIQHKILERIPHAENIIQNTRAHSTRRKI